MREAVLLSFCDPLPETCSRLWQLSRKDWQQLLTWLDTSGLALYFLERVTQLELCELFQPEILLRLRRNLAENTEKTEDLIAESAAIHRSFQNAELSYATLKGFSLWPSSVPKPELRSQLDLDFLISEKSAPAARRILEERGYRLRAVSGRSWEFKTDGVRHTSVQDIYKVVPNRSVELHLESEEAGGRSLLCRTEKLHFRGVCMPVLPRADLFLGQGLHLFKHVCSEFFRTAHLIEFRRHVIARRYDHAFWNELRSLAEQNRLAPIALGVITLLITRVMGEFAPEALTSWTVDRLPAAARLWVDLYGRHSVLASFPGSKLYLFLHRELQLFGAPAQRSLRRVLLPLRLPPAITHGTADEHLQARLRRYRAELHYLTFRMRFHTVEGLRYLRESIRWQQHLNGLAS
ncbi:hypothetical protein ACPOL_1926 [Acidisarcina polymorpha]|uniref:Nucleotidyltransferase family protein n=2 Tax=Acidisarcina polymorpha TaxID=2211140 RepID=A0A2Z5FWX3_9BACT|nr:hypothetical protein ACPOL_1926 [Acidisarcina polymorpha]